MLGFSKTDPKQKNVAPFNTSHHAGCAECHAVRLHHATRVSRVIQRRRLAPPALDLPLRMLPSPPRENWLRRHGAVLGGHFEVDLDLEVPALLGIGDQTRQKDDAEHWCAAPWSLSGIDCVSPRHHSAPVLDLF